MAEGSLSRTEGRACPMSSDMSSLRLLTARVRGATTDLGIEAQHAGDLPKRQFIVTLILEPSLPDCKVLSRQETKHGAVADIEELLQRFYSLGCL